MMTTAGFLNLTRRRLARALIAAACCIPAGLAGAASHQGHGHNGQDRGASHDHHQGHSATPIAQELVETDLAQAAVSISNASIRLPLPGQTSAVVYLTLHNRTGQELVLAAAEVQGSERAELHQHLHDDGMMRMRKVNRIVVPRGQSVELSPGGYHIMVYELAAVPADATLQRTYPVTLIFESGERTTVNAWPVH